MQMLLPNDLLIKILSLNRPKISYFQVSKLFNILANIAYEELKRYYIENVLVKFSFMINTDMKYYTREYRLLSWNEYRRFSNFELECDIDGYNEIKTGVYMERVKDERLISLADENLNHLNYENESWIDIKLNVYSQRDFEEDECVNDFGYCKYLMRNFHFAEYPSSLEILDYTDIVHPFELPECFLEFVTFNCYKLLKYMKRNKRCKFSLTKKAIKIALKNNCYENLKLYKKVEAERFVVLIEELKKDGYDFYKSIGKNYLCGVEFLKDCEVYPNVGNLIQVLNKSEVKVASRYVILNPNLLKELVECGFKFNDSFESNDDLFCVI